MDMNKTKATLLNPQSGTLLANISLVGEPIQVDGVFNCHSSLQRYVILSETNSLQASWFNQKVVLLRSGDRQQLVKIATYPSEGESQGHLNLLQGKFELYYENRQHQSKHQKRRWFTLFQTLLGA